jgi:protein-tyrosine-phosphatase
MDEDLRVAQAVRFVCSGNMVRSAFAELYARHLGCALPVDSCATTYRNPGLYPETRTALVRLGVDPAACDGFRPRHLDDLPEDGLTRVILGMTPAHLSAYRHQFGARDPLLLLDAIDGTGGSIADPVLEAVGFEEAFSAVARNVRALVGRLAAR